MGTASSALLSDAEDAHPASNLPELPVHRDALPIVKQQLETLDTRHVLWQGLIWPDQTMQWQITGQPPGANTNSDESPWLTRISLVLPHLGAIDATLHFDHSGVTINFAAAQPAAAMALYAGIEALRHSLRDAHVNPLSVTISPNAAP
jgi:hypothetical protein